MFGGFIYIYFMRWNIFALGIRKKLYHEKVQTAVGTVHSWLATVTLWCIISIRTMWDAPPGSQHCWLMDNAHLFLKSVTDGQNTSVPNICNYTASGVLKGFKDELHWLINYAALVAPMKSWNRHFIITLALISVIWGEQAMLKCDLVHLRSGLSSRSACLCCPQTEQKTTHFWLSHLGYVCEVHRMNVASVLCSIKSSNTKSLNAMTYEATEECWRGDVI